MNLQKKDYMKEAIRLATEGASQGFGGPFGAVVVKDDMIIGRGWNKVTSVHDPTAHAEVEAIREACHHLKNFQLEGCILYTSCEPCPMCLGAIYWSRLDVVYYACTKQDAADIDFDDKFIYSEIELPLNKRRIVFKEYMRKEALSAFDAWTQKENKTLY